MSTAEIKPTAEPQLVTADELLRDYHGQRCELIEGRVKLMSPTGFGHGSFERRIASLLGEYVDEHELGDVVTGEVGFLVARRPDTVLAPDVAFVTKDRLDAVGFTEKYFPEAPALAIEVVSPGDTADEVDEKARQWLAAGAKAVWVVYSRGRTVAVYRSLDNICVLTEEQSLSGEEVVPGFSVKVADLFLHAR
ncbi:Uma2 family endonuclease [Aeoliella sp. SH292]|uniref:Uma2 family endonuclease n=1 Tax=Aeoliella sp. SH292 TaxID=3454464 RepID=UPI003F9613F8